MPSQSPSSDRYPPANSPPILYTEHDIICGLFVPLGSLCGKGIPKEHAPLCSTLQEQRQGWRLNHFPGQPVPMLDNPLGEEKFPNIQSKPPLAQLEAISSCPITCYLGEETDPTSLQPPFRLPSLYCELLPGFQQLEQRGVETAQGQVVQPRPALGTGKGGSHLGHVIAARGLEENERQGQKIDMALQPLHLGKFQYKLPRQEETDTHLTTTSFQVVVESDEVSPEPPFLQAKQPQFPQPLLIRLALQTLHQLHCPSLDTLQQLNVLLVVRAPKVNTVFEGHSHFPSPAGHTVPDRSQDAVGFLGHLGTLLAHIQPAVNQHPQVLLCQAAFQPLFPKPVALHGVVVTQVQDLALGLVEPHTTDLSPSIQPVQIPLQSLPTLKQIDTPSQFDVICKLTEGALNPLIQIIDKDIKQDWPQN
ncbi:hypothetical protein QYF61_023339 [Mycteria americana]|uniref:Uncharacterized protein n=1 Tax=Mycteria americana TaxID=33587 RepID=A0AAN7MQU4_MYCAM|nr:hypothetical protein QYF61_023339 [Mycteria americana]